MSGDEPLTFETLRPFYQDLQRRQQRLCTLPRQVDFAIGEVTENGVQYTYDGDPGGRWCSRGTIVRICRTYHETGGSESPHEYGKDNNGDASCTIAVIVAYRGSVVRDGDPPLTRPPTTPASGITVVPGDASKDRFFALVFDNLIGLVIGFVAACAIPNDQVVLRGTALVVGYLGYFFLFEALVGSSPGKLLFGLWVRRIEGGRCSWRQAAVRTLARLIEVNPLLLGAIPAAIAVLASKDRQRLGDMLAGTVVCRGRGV